MNKYVLAGAALVALSGAASAADLTYEAPPAAAPVVTDAAFDWTGFYAGVHGGAIFGKTSGDFDESANGGVAGLQAGYNYQFGQFVIGAETDFAYTSINKDDVKVDWLGKTTLRAGYAIDNFLIYGKGGIAYGHAKAFDESKWSTGWTAGAGLEYAFTKNITGKLEYDYVDLSDKDFDGYRVGATAHEVLAGLNYKF